MKDRHVLIITLKSKKGLKTALMALEQTCGDWHGDIDEKRSYVTKLPLGIVEAHQKQSVVPPSEKTGIYVVYASCGRSNGWAVVRAHSKVDANRIMRESNWLTNGRISARETQTYDKYNEGMGDTVEDQLKYAALKYGKWLEIDWGT